MFQEDGGGFGPLSTDPTMEMLSFFDARDLLTMCCVNKRMNEMASDDRLWKRVTLERAKGKTHTTWKWESTVSNWKREFLESFTFTMVLPIHKSQIHYFERRDLPIKKFRAHICMSCFLRPRDLIVSASWDNSVYRLEEFSKEATLQDLIDLGMKRQIVIRWDNIQDQSTKIHRL
eukprot:TRINITY_DN6738_c0_g1_i1.p1 TRINITY_DN6738_c0_g1~~TRINITY_DN6738_c0_g1_i1.p1  ORF type:complete len:175 (-),score=26.57 TRINITY_DN6738_c0_g1_i1:18-542(-)